MATDTVEPTVQPTAQTGTTPNPIASNAQDFSDSNEEFVDNFADGPVEKPSDVPLGLGGERGKQSEPASSTLAADIVSETKQGGEQLPPHDSAGEPDPVEPVDEKGTEKSPEPTPEEPETPEIPPVLLQMAGLADVDAAKAAGLGSTEAIQAYIRGRGELLASAAKAEQPSSVHDLYRRPSQKTPAPPAPETEVDTEDSSDIQAFQIPDDKRDMLDEDTVAVIEQMNAHYQNELKTIRTSLSERENKSAVQQQQEQVQKFDKSIQSLGEDWQDVFGEGDGLELSRRAANDPTARVALEFRGELLETVEAIRDVNAKRGFEPMDLNREIHFALMQRFPDKFQQFVSGKPNGKPRDGVTANRPTKRNAPPKGRDDKALSDVDAMLRKRHGYGLDMGDDEEFDGDI